MREECKFFQIRTYPSGDVARFCALGLAPEAPWRCPEDCPRYEKRRSDAGFARGTLIPTSPPPEPELDPSMVRLLGTATEIISAAGPEIVAEQERLRREQEEAASRWWNKLRHSPRWRR
jgi:hypothetical protein